MKKEYNIIDSILIPIKSSKKTSILLILLFVVVGIIPSIQTIVLAKFIDAVGTVESNQVDMLNIVGWLLCIILCILVIWMSNTVMQLLGNRLEIDLKRKYRTQLTNKISRLKYQYVEDSETWNLISRISTKSEKRLRESYIKLLQFAAFNIEIFGLLLIFLNQSWKTVCVIILTSIPIFFIAFKSGKGAYKVKFKTQIYHRKHEYLAEVLTSREAVQERKIFGYGKSLNDLWMQRYEKARKVELVVRFKWFVKMKLSGVVTSIICIITTFLLIPQLIDGELNIGLFMSLVNATYSLVNKMTWKFTSDIEGIANISEYMKELTRFAQLEEVSYENQNIASGKLESIEFVNVKFKYPGTDQYILNGFSYKFISGTKYALLGINGAGKSTLVKLLLGLYEDYEGEILLNDREIRKYDYNTRLSYFSVVYQDFAKYSLSIKDNIVIGTEECKVKDEDIMNMLDTIGLKDKIDNLDAGLDTKIGKIYSDGQDLSGGQWQKIAIARALIGEASILIMDEPTSALDPIAESMFYKNFVTYCAERMVILISHRLGAASQADQILVISEGKLEEFGQHNQLMKQGKLYAEMYENQRGWYSDEIL